MGGLRGRRRGRETCLGAVNCRGPLRVGGGLTQMLHWHDFSCPGDQSCLGYPERRHSSPSGQGREATVANRPTPDDQVVGETSSKPDIAV